MKPRTFFLAVVVPFAAWAAAAPVLDSGIAALHWDRLYRLGLPAMLVALVPLISGWKAPEPA